MKTTYKAFSSVVKLSPDEPRTLIATISTDAVDRDGEVVIPLGMRTKDFEKVPIVFFDHAWAKYGIPAKEKLPIGKVTAIDRTENTIEAKVRFTERPPTHPEGEEWLADTIFWLYQDGAMASWSIGFDATERRVPTKRDLEKYGEECRLVTSKWSMVELSAVTLGCNQEAMTQAVSKGHVSKAFADTLMPAKAADDDETDETDETKPEAGACKKCEKQYPVGDMTPGGDGDFYCDDCVEEDQLEDDREKRKAAIPQPKHVVAAVDVSAAAADGPPAARHVTRLVDFGGRKRRPARAPDPAAQVRKMVVRQIAKARGAIYADE